MTVSETDKVLIVGAGCFGISTAYHLLKRGFKDVTILDRAEVHPAPDAASTDLNKIVRTSYSDSFYTRFAQEAVHLWKTEEWGDTYHESGVLVLGSKEAPYGAKSYENDIAAGVRVTKLDTGATISSVLPPNIKCGSLDNLAGYLNHDGGWAYASQGISLMTERVKEMGGKLFTGKAARKLLRREEDGRTLGVECKDGTRFEADLTVLATGSWTASTFTEFDLGHCLATGQSISTVQLTSEETDRYRLCPVVVDFTSGFYIFPPNKDGIIKLGIHAAGYTSYTSSDTQKAISTPRTILSHGEQGLRIPQTMVKTLRTKLRELYPELAEKPFIHTRLCWYTDTPDAHWMIGAHPSDPALVFATAGSGHAYKFLPNIGTLVADAIQGTLDEDLVKKFSPFREHDGFDLSRGPEGAKELRHEELCMPEDLLP